MDRLWAPWRLDYITGEKIDGCIFCVFPQKDEDKKYHILSRGKHAYIIMNAFPYSNGHLLIVPYRHIADINALTDEESLEIMQLTQKCSVALKAICNPDGFNIGINMGIAAGAGIANHLHQHIVPRWNGDTNFISVFGDVKVIPEDLETTYDKLKIEFDKLTD